MGKLEAGFCILHQFESSLHGIVFCINFSNAIKFKLMAFRCKLIDINIKMCFKNSRCKLSRYRPIFFIAFEKGFSARSY